MNRGLAVARARRQRQRPGRARGRRQGRNRARAGWGVGELPKAPPSGEPAGKMPHRALRHGDAIAKAMEACPTDEEGKTPVFDAIVCAVNEVRNLRRENLIYLREIKNYGEVIRRTIVPVTARPEKHHRELADAQDELLKFVERFVGRARVAISLQTKFLERMDKGIAAERELERDAKAHRDSLEEVVEPPYSRMVAEYETWYLANQARLWRMYRDFVQPVLDIVIGMTRDMRNAAALARKGNLRNAESVRASRLGWQHAIELLSRGGDGKGILEKVLQGWFGEDPAKKIAGGLVFVALGLAALFILPPLAKAIGRRAEAMSLPAPKARRRAFRAEARTRKYKARARKKKK